jgi:hypothetical protein
MKFVCSLLIFFVVSNVKVIGQNIEPKVLNIAVFSPLYLDSTFDDDEYKYGKLVPPFAIQGVEYYFGAKAAMDSLKRSGANFNYFVFDSKSTIKNISTLIANDELSDMDMLIGSVIGTDVKLLADYALKKNIPFISATFPNDAGINNNPNFLLLNNTLKTNCKALHQLIQNKFKEQRIIVLSKTGKQEERISNYFKEFEKNATEGSLAITYANLGDSLNEENIEKYLDSTLLSTYIIASTDVNFAKKIAAVIIKNKQQEQVNLMGLPTWDDATDFNKKEYEGLHFYFTTPMIKPTQALAIKLANKFSAKYGTSPGDNMYRGYESVFKFSQLLAKHKTNILSNFGDKSFSSIVGYDIQPVMLNSANMSLDYFENKKVCLMKRFNGITTQIIQQ